MQGYIPTPVTTSRLVFDADLIVPAGHKITVDHITETTAAGGVNVDVALIPSVSVTTPITNTDHILPKIAGFVDVSVPLHVDHIAEKTGSNHVIMDSIIDTTT